MSDLGSELVKRYGLTAVIVAVLVAPIVWALAHFASAPGTPVKVLWGLVEYTKSPARQDDPSASPPAPVPLVAEAPPVSPTEAPSADSQVVPGPLTLEVTHGLESDGYLMVLEELRARSGVRELRPLESDRPIHETPPGTFFFVFGPWLETRSYSEGSEVLLEKRVTRFQSRSWGYFEAHHRTSGQVFLLAYSAESDADRIRSLTGDRTFQLTVAPRPWTSFSSLVQLPFDRIVSSKSRELEIEDNKTLVVLDLSIR